MDTSAAPGVRQTSAGCGYGQLVALIAVHGGRVALRLGGPERWFSESGYIFVPAEFPGGAAVRGEALDACVMRLAMQHLGCPARIVSSPNTYGRSPRHAVDRIAVDRIDEAAGHHRPVLRIERLAPPPGHAGAHKPDTIDIRAYLATMQDTGSPHRADHPRDSLVLWLTPQTLRNAVRGVPLADVLTSPDAMLVGDRSALPSNAFVYVPSEYGERFLVRVVAKYGSEVLDVR